MSRNDPSGSRLATSRLSPGTTRLSLSGVQSGVGSGMFARLTARSRFRCRTTLFRVTDAIANPSHELSTNGVGPWPGALPDDPRYDRDLLEHGDTRNVIDRYRYWTIEA